MRLVADESSRSIEALNVTGEHEAPAKVLGDEFDGFSACAHLIGDRTPPVAAQRPPAYTDCNKAGLPVDL